MKRPPSSTRSKPGQSSIPETVSEDFDPWADFSKSTSNDTSTSSTPFSPFDPSPTPQQQPQQQPQQPTLKTKRSGSVDHYSSLLSVNTTFSNPTTPLKVTTTPPAGTNLGISNTTTSRLRAGSAAPALSIQPSLPHTDTAGLAQSEVLAIQAQLEALQAAQLALSARLGQLSVTLQPVLPVTPRMGTSPDVYSGGGGGGISTPVPFPPAPTYHQGISTPVPFPPASQHTSASTTTSSSTEYDPFADFP
jgi:hypothetical protein